ncbi:MAG: hypothetical protein AAGJ18_27490 [Bacteroidota bacterium]
MNNVLENNFFSRLGRLISRPKVRFTIEREHHVDLQFHPAESGVTVTSKSPIDTVDFDVLEDKFATNFLPAGTLSLATFQEIVHKEAADSALKDQDSFLIEMSLDAKNCAFLTDADQKDLTIDCLKLLVKDGLAAPIYTFSPTNKIWLFFSNIPADLAVQKANAAFRATQQLVRSTLDFHRSLLDLNMYSVQDGIPAIC